MDSEQKAKDFVKMAVADLEAGMASSIPYSICFHAQQATEKYLKAFLVLHGRPVPRSHDVADLIKRCADIDPSLGELLPYASSLNLFGVEIRYEPSKEEAERKCPEVWSAMLTIVNTLKQKLPGSVASTDSDG